MLIGERKLDTALETIDDKVRDDSIRMEWQKIEYAACLDSAKQTYESLIAVGKLTLAQNGTLFAAIAVIVDRNGILGPEKSNVAVSNILVVTIGVIAIIAIAFNLGGLFSTRNSMKFLKGLSVRFFTLEFEIYGKSNEHILNGVELKPEDHLGSVMHYHGFTAHLNRAPVYSNVFFYFIIFGWTWVLVFAFYLI